MRGPTRGGGIIEIHKSFGYCPLTCIPLTLMAPHLSPALSLTAPMVQSLDVHMLSVNMLLYPNRATISATVVLQLRSPSVWRWTIPRPTSRRRGCCTLRVNPSFSVWQRHPNAYHLSRMLLYL
jgi:hypothetical protein